MDPTELIAHLRLAGFVFCAPFSVHEWLQPAPSGRAFGQRPGSLFLDYLRACSLLFCGSLSLAPAFVPLDTLPLWSPAIPLGDPCGFSHPIIPLICCFLSKIF